MLISAYWASWEPWYTVTRPKEDIGWTVEGIETGDVEFDMTTGDFLEMDFVFLTNFVNNNGKLFKEICTKKRLQKTSLLISWNTVISLIEMKTLHRHTLS